MPPGKGGLFHRDERRHPDCIHTNQILRPFDEANVTTALLGERPGGQHRTNDNAVDGRVGQHPIGNITGS